jgi:hypothetical protein
MGSIVQVSNPTQASISVSIKSVYRYPEQISLASSSLNRQVSFAMLSASITPYAYTEVITVPI